MREKKYADILKKYEELENEEKLSLTREMKFKDLQDSMDQEDTSKSETKKEKRENTSKKTQKKEIKDEKTNDKLKIENEIEEIREAENKKRKELKIKEVKEEKTESGNKEIDDDIYLTTSFKPLRKRVSFSKIMKKAIIFIVIILVIGSVGYFVGMPIYKKYINSKPKIIFDKTVEYVSDKMINVIDDFNLGNNSLFADVSFRVDNNEEELSENLFGYSLGVEPKRYENFLYLEKDSSSYGINELFNDGDSYTNFSTSDKYLEMKENSIDKVYNKYSKYLDSVLDVSNDDLRYVVLKERDIIKSLLLNEYITSIKSEIEINGETLNVVKNSYVIDKNNIKKIQKKYYDEVIKDDKLVKVLAEISNLTVKEYKSKLSDMVDSEIDEDYKLAFNIYTVDGIKVVGFDIEKNGFCLFYLYSYDNYFDFYINLTRENKCKKTDECSLNNQRVIDIKGKKNDLIEADIKYNGEKVLDLDITSLTKEKVEFSYLFKPKKKEYIGDFVLINTEENNYEVDLSLNYDEYEYNFNSLLDLHYDDFTNIDEEDVVKYTLKSYTNELSEFYDEIDEIGIKEEFMNFKDFIDRFIDKLSKK